ncbi:MAG: FKBP-type peptidyl-prolyl cis-trans isomerase, partial [Polaribacter sp.]
QLKKLQKKYSDSLQLKKAIDSTRMIVVNNIVQKDTINTIKIIRIGAKAKHFNASKVFDTTFSEFTESQKNKQEKAAKEEQNRYATYLKNKTVFLAKMNVAKATKTNSGLRILKLKETKGKKVVANKPLKVNYIIYLADGKKIQSTYDPGGVPLTCLLNDTSKPMISGFKEGVLKLREGEKARLFIPYYLGFGTEKHDPFPARADLVFEIEILKVGI